MKRIALTIAATLALATSAHAGIVATIANKAGNTIKLTDGRGNDCSEGWNLLLATTKTGQTISGCWMYNSDINEVIAVYEDGDTYTYPAHSLRLTTYFHAKYNKGRNL